MKHIVSIVYRSLLLVLCLTGMTLSAQNIVKDSNHTEIDTVQVNKVQEKVQTIQTLLSTVNIIKLKMDTLREQQLRDDLTEDEKNVLSTEMEQLKFELEKNQQNLMVISSGADASIFTEEPPIKKVDINSEIEEIIYPVIEDIKQATNRPREIENLKGELSKNERRIEEVELAITNLEKLLEECENNNVRSYLERRISYWQDQDLEIKDETSAIKLHLEEKQNSKKGFFEVLSVIMHKFFSKHGRNLLFAFLALIGTFYLLRFLHRLFRAKVRTERYKNWRSIVRIVDLLYYIFTFFASFAFFIMVLLSASDWLLLGLTLLILIGGIWVMKNAIPVFIEQTKLILDLGPVREGERVMYNHVPYIVDSISMYSHLVNPEMKEHQVILPIKDLIELRSRPFSQDEPWFPVSIDDWIKLDDGNMGQVVRMSPDTVEVKVERGSLKNYTIENFINNNPQNLSREGFAVEQMIGIHYKYRYVVNEYLCDRLEKYIVKTLDNGIYKDWIQDVRVELEVMNESSLDVEVYVRFHGDAAYDYVEIPGRINQIFLDALNELEIEIPYPHITVDGLNSNK